MSLMIPEEGSFTLSAYMESPGYVRFVPKGYLVSRREGETWVAPIIPQLFYGASGEQLGTWRQYIPEAGEVTLLSRVAGHPEVPREQLFWRRIGGVEIPNFQSGAVSLSSSPTDFLWGLFIGTFFLGAFLWTSLGRAFTMEAVSRGAGVTESRVKEWIERGG